MRHAYLIMAHTNWKLLSQLLYVLDDPDTDFYLLIDKKVQEPLQTLLNRFPEKSKLIELPRIEINWGGYSMIQAILNLLKKAIEGHYEYYHLLQGSDFPIKNKKEINTFFEKNSGKEFIEFSPGNYEFAKWKCDYRHFFVDNRFYRKNWLLKFISHGIVEFQKIIGKTAENLHQKLYHGSSLFSITHECAVYLMEKEVEINKAYKWSIAADEVFLQTLVIHSSFKNQLYHFEKRDGNARYIDWEHREGNSPKTFTDNDAELLLSLPEQYCFARKFSDANMELVERIIKEIKI